MPQVSRLLGAWLFVMAASAAMLKVLDHVPTFLAGTPRNARVFRTVEEAERAVGARFWLPGYYPQELQWPPGRIEVSHSAPAVVVLRIDGTDGERERLVIAQSIAGAVPPPSAMLPVGRTMEVSNLRVGDHPAQLVRVLLGPRELHDLRWDQAGRRVTLRYSGPVDRLLLIAGSLERAIQ